VIVYGQAEIGVGAAADFAADAPMPRSKKGTRPSQRFTEFASMLFLLFNPGIINP
jgi:hypothetical protein